MSESDQQQIRTQSYGMRQWRITGSDGQVVATITATVGETLKLEHEDTFRFGYSSNLAVQIGQSLVDAAMFVADIHWEGDTPDD